MQQNIWLVSLKAKCLKKTGNGQYFTSCGAAGMCGTENGVGGGGGQRRSELCRYSIGK